MIQANCIVCCCEMKKIFDYQTFTYSRCPACQHVTTLPYPSALQIQEHYSAGFKEGNYNTMRKHSDVYMLTMAKFVKLIKSYYGKQGRSLEELSVLDVGCFTGEFLCSMQSEGCDVYGVEYQKEAAEIANKKLPGKIINADILEDDFFPPQNEFDIITLLGVLEHVADPVSLIERVTAWLKKDGLLMIQTPNSSSILARFMRKYWPPYAPIEHIHLFSHKSLFAVLSRCGFKNIATKKHWKSLSVSYVYSMFKTFGPEFHKILKPFYSILPAFIVNRRLPFYAGETIVLANF